MRYVTICQKCQQSKVDQYAWQTKTIPNLVGNQAFEEIAMDFIGELLESEQYNAILVITDHFTKVQHYIPVNTNWTSADVADTYICYIWRLYGLPQHVTFDRGSQYASLFTKELNKKRYIGLRLSTAYHPQTDGLSEHAIQTLKQYLRIFYHDQQYRWATWLALAEFAYNMATTSYGYSSQHVLYGFHPHPIQVNDKPVSSSAAEEWLEHMTTVYAQIQQILKHINDKRSTMHLEISCQFNVSNWVLVYLQYLILKAGNNHSLM